MFTNLMRLVKRLHSDERGAEGLEKLLILGLVIIPLLGVLIYFKNEIGEWVDSQWTEVKTHGVVDVTRPSGN